MRFSGNETRDTARTDTAGCCGRETERIGRMIEIVRKQNQTDAPRLVEAASGIRYFTFDSLTRSGLVTHAFTTRVGGVSQGCFSQMNLCMTRGDSAEAVLENHRRMAQALGYDVNMVVHSAQTHTANVRVVGMAEAGSGITKPQRLSDVDGMVTNVPGLVLMTFYADCTPLYFLDPVKRVIGLSHSGWKGTKNRIGKETVRCMEDTYGCHASDILACIGPSICGDCYEVGAEVAEAFREAFGAASGAFVHAGAQAGKYQLDMWAANRHVLLEAGVLPEHIECTNVCTRCNPKLLFSHRVMGNARGNLSAILMLKGETAASGK